ncbi:MAG: YicC family protein [Schleiferiaceae bacterium]|nr:YicC family protein [Schleiferiaceae bacterium]
MTGFGKETLLLPSKKITVEVKSLNSKSLDLNLRLPQGFKEKEMELRNLVAAELHRGKVDFVMTEEITGAEEAPKVNAPVVLAYIHQLKQIEHKANLSSDLLEIAMRLPDVVSVEKGEINPDEWQAIADASARAIQHLNHFRAVEGKKLEDDLLQRVTNIEKLLDAVVPFEEERIQRLRERIEKNLEQLKEKPEESRLEQELIFYIEKFDINEEKVRLRAHIEYFRTIATQESTNGRKLNFVTQEMGREINTLGSKANHADMQRCVVQMKDELEKVKEQLLNVL